MPVYKQVNTAYHFCLLSKKYDIICYKDHKNELYLMVLYTQGHVHPFSRKSELVLLNAYNFNHDYREIFRDVHLKETFCISCSAINFTSKSRIVLNNWAAEALIQVLHQFASLLEAHLSAKILFIT